MQWFTDYVKHKFKRFMGEQSRYKENNDWIACKQCKSVTYIKEIRDYLFTCPKCKHHDYISNRDRIETLITDYQYLEIPVRKEDPLEFQDIIKYKDRLSAARKKTDQYDAATLATGMLNNRKVTIFSMDFRFMGGSMGTHLGRTFIYGADYSIKNQTPYIVFTSSGGARMQEGIHSLMQMPSTVNAVNRLKKTQIPYIVVWCYPTMGGVAASFAALGDISIAEENAIIGFAGRRVIENTLKTELPQDFQTAEFQMQQGMVDLILHRTEVKKQLIKILNII